MNEIKKAFEGGTHWKEKYFKEDTELGKIPDFDKYIFLSLCEAVSDNKLPIKQVIENYSILFTNKQLHTIAIEYGYYELLAIQNEMIKNTTENAEFVTGLQLSNIVTNLKNIKEVIELYKAKINEI